MPSPGTQASLSINGTAIDDTARATLNLNRTPIDVTSVGASHRAFEYGITEGTCDAEFFLDASHVSILQGLQNGSKLTGVEIVWATGISIKGNALVTNVSITVAPNAVAQCSCTFTNDGSFTWDLA
jgi:hypothetical protein